LSEDFEIEIHCPECDAEIDVKLSQIKHQVTVSCPQCHMNIQMKPDNPPGTYETQTAEGTFTNILQKQD